MMEAERIAALEAENEELRERIRQIEAEVLGAEWQAPLEFGLTPSEERALAALVARERCSTNGLMLALYDDMDQPEPKIIDVFVCKIRKKLAPFGIEIITVWGRGYMLAAESRERLRAGRAFATVGQREDSDAEALRCLTLKSDRFVL